MSWVAGTSASVLPPGSGRLDGGWLPRGQRRRASAWAFLLLFLLLCEGPALIREAGAVTVSDPEYIIDSWETEQGLPENSATAMVQTPDGYLWFGTFEGLVRFDGIRFTVFDSSNTPGLPSPGIVNLHLDASRRLWISTYRGLVVSEPDRWLTLHPVPGWTGDFVRTFSEYAGVLCLSSFNGHVFRHADGHLEELRGHEGLAGAGYCVHVDGGGRIWITQEAGAYLAGWENDAWRTSPIAADLFRKFTGMTRSRDGSLLVLRDNEVLRVQGDSVLSSRRIRWSERIPPCWSMYEDVEGRLWVAADGLYRVDPDGGVRQFRAPTHLTYDGIRCVAEDAERSLWVGSSGGGLMRFRRRSFTNLGPEHGLTERNVRAVLEATPGTVLLGTYRAGIFEWKDGRVTPLPPERQPFSRWVQCLLRDRGGQLWVGSYAGSRTIPAVTVFGPDGSRRALPWDIGGRSVEALFQDAAGRIWIGGEETVTCFENGQYLAQPRTETVRLRAVNCFAEDVNQSTLWASGDEGLFRRRGGAWEEVRDPAGQSWRDIFCLHVDAEGGLWVGSAGSRLARWRADRWALVPDVPEFPSRHVSCILDDGHGQWWLGSNRGIFRVSRELLNLAVDGVVPRWQSQWFDRNDGLASVECASGVQNTALIDSADHLWFATLKGAVIADPHAVPVNTRPPPVVFERIRVEDARGHFRDLPVSGSEPVQVPSDTREIAVFLAGLSYVAPEKVRFACRIDGVDREWRDIGARRVLYFYKPAHGHYRLRARAANNDGLWNDVGATLAFTVQPLLVETLWFRGLVGFGFGGVVLWMVRRAQQRRFERAQERWERQGALDRERVRFATLIQHISDAILLLDAEGHVVYESLSVSRILGSESAERLGKDALDLVHPEDRDRVRDSFQRVIAQPRIKGPVEFRIQHPARGWVHFEAVADNLLGQPPVDGVLITARDVTERKRVEAEKGQLQAALIQSQKMDAIGHLAGGVAHDFNNILSAILMNLDLLRTESGLGADAREVLQELTSETERASGLTRQLLLFSRRQVLHPRTIELHSALGNLLRLLHRLIGEQLHLEFHGGSDDIWLTVDPGLLDQVVLNLVVNARDATPAGGRIILAASEVTLPEGAPLPHPDARPGRFACLSVADTGAGMTEDVRRRVFEPFFTTKELGKGTGLGLATVYGIVTQHRGWIEIESAEGKGSTFRVYFPASDPSTSPEDAPPEAPRGGSETILLVEDSPGLRRVTATTLARYGYRVLAAADAAEAREHWNRAPDAIDLLLTDMVLPGAENGLELGRALRRERPGLRWLLMSGYSHDLVEKGFVPDVEVGFLPKPISPSGLASRIRACLDEGAAAPK